MLKKIGTYSSEGLHPLPGVVPGTVFVYLFLSVFVQREGVNVRQRYCRERLTVEPGRLNQEILKMWIVRSKRK